MSNFEHWLRSLRSAQPDNLCSRRLGPLSERCGRVLAHLTIITPQPTQNTGQRQLDNTDGGRFEGPDHWKISAKHFYFLGCFFKYKEIFAQKDLGDHFTLNTWSNYHRVHLYGSAFNYQIIDNGLHVEMFC